MNEHEVVVRRSFRHAPERVWRAWTDPERLASWWGPDGFEIITESFDFRAGGSWVHTLAHPEHGRFPNYIRFATVEPPRRLTYEHAGENDISFRVEVDFVATEVGTTVVMRSIFPTAESRALVVEQYGAIEGARQMMSSLEKYLGRAPKVRVSAFAVSVDGFGAGPDQSHENPLGVGGTDLHRWFFPTRTFRENHGVGDGGTTGIDDDFAARSMAGVGAWILGRNMFGPIRGPWPDDSWRGWWGEDPPYHCPVFVLTHHPRADFEMAGGTTFHFVTGGIHEALDRARTAAGDLDVRIGGGVDTIRQFLTAGLIDELHLVVSGVILGRGEPLLRDLDLPALGFHVTEEVATPAALHVVLERCDTPE